MIMRIKNEVMEVNGITYPVNVYYERRNAARASISRKAVIIRIPLFLNREEQFRQVLQMKAWARKKLDENPERFKPKIEKEYKHGDTLKIGSEEYTLNIISKDKDSSSASIVGNIVYLHITSRLPEEQQKKHIATLLSRSIAQKRIPQLKKRIDELNTKYFNQKINKIFFKNMSSRWGSCSEHRNINISTSFCIAICFLFSLYNFDFPTSRVNTIILFFIKSPQILYKVALPIPAFFAISVIEKSRSLSVNR